MDFLIPPIKQLIKGKELAKRFPSSFSIGGNSKNVNLALEYIKNELTLELSLTILPIKKNIKPDFVIEIKRNILAKIKALPNSQIIRNQAYRLIWNPGKEVKIEAESIAGALFGAVTFRQIIVNQQVGMEIPLCVIEDWPTMEWRGLQDDLARGRVFNMTHAKRQIKRVAEMKGNFYQLYLETRFAFPSHPDIGLPGSMTPQDARELEKYAKRFGVFVLPQINTFGHLELMLKKEKYKHLREKPNNTEVICPLHSETRPLLRDLLNDIMDAFNSPFIHVGLDEIRQIGVCSYCKNKDPGEIFLGHVKFLHGIVSKRNRRMLMWHDMILNRNEFAGSIANGSSKWAEKVLKTLPKDIIICDWQYQNSGDTSHYFTKKGFDVIVCPFFATNAEKNSPAFPMPSAWHTSRLIAQGLRAGSIGVIQTTWGDGETGVFENNWFIYAHAFSSAWQPAQRVILHKIATNWARVEMGISGVLFEDLVSKLSMPLFRGMSEQHYFKRNKKDLFYTSSQWVDVAEKGMIARDIAFLLEQEKILHDLLKSAKRGYEYLNLLDVPIIQKRLMIKEVLKIGKASRLYKQALKIRDNTEKRKKLLDQIYLLLEDYAKDLDEEVEVKQRISASQGNAKEQLDSIKLRQLKIRSLKKKMNKNKLPSFNKIFWDQKLISFNR